MKAATFALSISSAIATLEFINQTLPDGQNPIAVESQPSVSSIPARTLVGYWHDFANPAGPTYPLSQVSKDLDVIVVAFGTSLGGGSVGFDVDPAAGSEAQFIADIKTLKAAGKTIVLSLGGQNGAVSLSDATETNNFVNSVYGLIQKFGFDGIDLDLENGVSQGLPIVNNLITAVKQLRQKVGSSFYLSMAPEHPYVHGGYVAYGSIWGAYLPIIDGLRDILTQIHVQYYNNGGFTYTDGRTLNEGTVDCLVGGSVMLIEGFKTSYGTGWEFKGLRPDQVSFGVPSGPSAAGRGQVTPEVVRRAVTCLYQGVGCDTIKPPSTYSSYRGVMSWSINWDSHDGFGFSKNARSALNGLGGNNPTPSPPPTQKPTSGPTPKPSVSTPKPSTSAPSTPSPSGSNQCGGNHNVCFWPLTQQVLPYSQSDCLKFTGQFIWCP